MPALIAPRNTMQALSRERDLPLAAGVKVFAGAIVAMNAAGFLVPAAAIATNITMGRAEVSVDNTLGMAGAVTAKTRRGLFLLNNSFGADAIGNTEIGKPVYIVDDNTVAKTSNSGARPVAGNCHAIDVQGIWVDI